MVAGLVIATFIVFVAVDYYLQRRRPQPVEVKSAARQAPLDALPIPMNIVGGFKVPAHLSYHPGRGSHRFEMLSPIEGEVVDVNPEVLRDPSLAHEDPYGVGWLVAVNAPAVEGNLKNLLHGRLAQRWMEESVAALHARVSPGAEARLQDGGQATSDALSLVPEFQWEKFIHEMLLA
jgi:hypothetical protein